MDIEQESVVLPPSLSPKASNEMNDEPQSSVVQDRPSTPDKCAVCLNNKQMEIIARIDSCTHTFCFSCILEWSKVRAICPLCKQAFKLITRERYSGEIVEEVCVETPASGSSRRFNNLNEVLTWVDQHRRDTSQESTQPGRRPHDLFRQMVYMEWLNTVQALVRRPNNRRNGYLTPFVRGTNTISLTDLIPLDSIRRLLHRYLRQTTSELRQSTIYSQATRQTVAFRKYIYLNRVFVNSPLLGHNRDTLTIRECSPTWYASNPACLHRLVPFLARELLALLWNDERTIEHVIQEILTTIQIHEIRSAVLTRKLHEYLGRFTKHFVHEFYTFASCPYDLAGFDRYAQYPNINTPSAPETTPLQIQLDDDDDGDEETPIIIDETNDLPINTIDLTSSSTTTTTTSETTPTSSRRASSPECEIVEYVQANRERSPTLIVLSEDEAGGDDDDDDDDREIIHSEETEEQEQQQQNEATSSRKRKHHHDRRHHSKRTTTSVSNHRSPESVVLDDEDPQHEQINQSAAPNSTTPPITTLDETDDD